MRISVIPSIAELQREVGEGKCPFCEAPLPPMRPLGRPRTRGPGPVQRGREPIQCGAPDCERSYHRLNKTVQTEKKWARGLTSQGQVPTRVFGKHRPETT